MKKLMLTLVAVGFSSTAFAQAAVTFTSADADTSGGVTLEEAQVAWPDLTQEAFTAADTSQDGQLDQAEFDAFVATLPAQ